jgi:hypothetical protein
MWMRMCGVVVMGVWLAGCATTPGVAKMQGRALTPAQEAECTQRAMGSVEAANAGQSTPATVGDFEGWNEQRRDWVSRNNPCLDTAQRVARAAEEASAEERFAVTRARMLLDSGEHEEARAALVPAFYAAAPADSAIYALVRKASAGLTAQDQRLDPGMCRVIAPASGEPVVVWSGSGEARIRCVLSPEARDAGGSVRLVLRKRLGPSERRVVWTWTAPQEARVTGQVEASLGMPVKLDDEIMGGRAYFTLSAELVAGTGATRTVGRGELFWFAAP